MLGCMISDPSPRSPRIGLNDCPLYTISTQTKRAVNKVGYPIEQSGTDDLENEILARGQRVPTSHWHTEGVSDVIYIS